MSIEYDIALSFAGEDRSYVEQVALALRAHDIRVFYDAYEQPHLWGKDLYQHLSDVYRNRARYCVVFISKSYAQRLWPRHELASAQARAFEENREYILPARFDDTEVPGILPTVGHIDLRTKTPQEFALAIVQKLRAPSGPPVPVPIPPLDLFRKTIAVQTSIKLTSPLAGEAVAQHHLVEGIVSPPTAHVIVVIRPLRASPYCWVQPPITVHADGAWRGYVHVGPVDSRYVGDRFQIMAFVNPRNAVKTGQRLLDWPEAQARSDVVEVRRA